MEDTKNRCGDFEAVAVKFIRFTMPRRSGLKDGRERLKFTFQELWIMTVAVLCRCFKDLGASPRSVRERTVCQNVAFKDSRDEFRL
jgi:hypothetical protein